MLHLEGKGQAWKDAEEGRHRAGAGCLLPLLAVVVMGWRERAWSPGFEERGCFKAQETEVTLG